MSLEEALFATGVLGLALILGVGLFAFGVRQMLRARRSLYWLSAPARTRCCLAPSRL